MRRASGSAWRRPFKTAAAVLTVCLGLVVLVGDAFADASNPILGTITATISGETATTLTISVKGQWNWMSHSSDCNFDRAATGAAIVWNDTTETAWLVDGIGLGVKTQRPNDPNPIDRMVHPADRGNLATSPTLPGAASQKYVDPASNNPADYASWKGGCGREPVSVKTPVLVQAASHAGQLVTMTTATAHGIPVGVTDRSVQVFSMFNAAYNSPAANKDKNFVAATATSATTFTYTAAASLTGVAGCTTTTACKGKTNTGPWGSWGYETSGGVPYPNVDPAQTNSHAFTHTYLKSALPDKICVNFYDVHGGGTGTKLQAVNGAKEITVDDNGDNSIETNDFDVTDGANCIVVKSPHIVTHATASVTIGSDASDSADLSGTATGAGGTITFKAYAPNDPNCLGTAEFTSGTFAVNGDGTYGPATFTPTKVGDYHWIASYTGDPATLTTPVSGSCGDTGETTSVGRASPGLTTTSTVSASLNSQASVNIHDVAHVTQPPGTINTTGAVTFNVYGPGDTTCQTSLATLQATPTPTNGAGDYTSANYAATTPGRYRWIAHLAADSNNNAANTACNDANESTLVLNPVIDVRKTPANQTVPLNGVAHFTIVVENDGDAILHDVTIGDALASGCARSAALTAGLIGAVGNNDAFFDPGESFTYTCDSDPVLAPFTNVVTACGLDPLNNSVCDTDTNGGAPPPNCPASEADRCATVGVSSLTSKQDFQPRDTGHLAGLVNPNGTLTFRLFKGTTCTLVADELDLNGGAGGTALTAAVNANGDYTVTAADFLSTMLGSTNTAGTYSWKLTYTGDTHGNANIIGDCGDENFVVDNG